MKWAEIASRVNGIVFLALLATAPRAMAEQLLAPVDLARWLAGDDIPLIIDVRGREAYRTGTVDGALDAGQDPAGYLPDGRGGPVVVLAPSPWPEAERRRWVARLEMAHHTVYRLQGGVAEWQAAGLPVVAPQESFVRPGTVPFLIPRGLCEANEPAQSYR